MDEKGWDTAESLTHMRIDNTCQSRIDDKETRGRGLSWCWWCGRNAFRANGTFRRGDIPI